MKGFLIEYDRKNGRLLSLTPFPDIMSATLKRIERDAERTNPDIEIVAIGAANEQALRISHSRYFPSNQAKHSA